MGRNEKRLCLLKIQTKSLGVEQDDWSIEFDAEHMHFGQDGLGDFDWSNKADDAPVSLALMATNSEVPYCSKCSKSYKKLLESYQTERDNFQRARTEILGYQMSLESLEVMLKTHEKNEYAWGDKYEQMEYDLKIRDLKLEEKQKELDQALKERDDFKVKLEKWSNASVLQNEVLNKQRYVSDKSCIGFGIESSNSMESDISSGDETLTDSTYENFKREKAYKAVPPPTDWVDSDDEETDVSESQKETAFNSENSETSFENRSPNSQNSVGQELLGQSSLGTKIGQYLTRYEVDKLLARTKRLPEEKCKQYLSKKKVTANVTISRAIQKKIPVLCLIIDSRNAHGNKECSYPLSPKLQDFVEEDLMASQKKISVGILYKRAKGIRVYNKRSQERFKNCLHVNFLEESGEDKREKMDGKSAFLYANITKRYIVKQPPGFEYPAASKQGLQSCAMHFIGLHQDAYQEHVDDNNIVSTNKSSMAERNLKILRKRIQDEFPWVYDFGLSHCNLNLLQDQTCMFAVLSVVQDFKSLAKGILTPMLSKGSFMDLREHQPNYGRSTSGGCTNNLAEDYFLAMQETNKLRLTPLAEAEYVAAAICCAQVSWMQINT
ncbi:hypothetical protein Tco_0529281 [Tanacetum coccineum]